MRICVHTCVNMYIHINIHTYIHTYVHTYVHTYIRTYVYTYIRTYIHTYIQTYVCHVFRRLVSLFTFVFFRATTLYQAYVPFKVVGVYGFGVSGFRISRFGGFGVGDSGSSMR